MNWWNIFREALCFYFIGAGIVFLLEHDVEALLRSILDAAIWPLRVILGAWDLVDELREGWPGWDGEVTREKMKAKKP